MVTVFTSWESGLSSHYAGAREEPQAQQQTYLPTEPLHPPTSDVLEKKQGITNAALGYC